MSRWLAAVLAGLVLASAWGCAAKKCCTGCPSYDSGLPVEALASVSRGTIDVQTDAVGPLSEVELALGPHLVKGALDYYGLAPEACQCLAAANSEVGNRLRSERRATAASTSCDKKCGNGCCRTLEILAAAEQEARNISASGALEVYYRLAEAEAQIDLIDRSLAEIDEVVAEIERLQGSGLQVPDDAHELPRRRNEIVGQRIGAEYAIVRLNLRLWQLIGIKPDNDTQRIWPQADLAVQVEPIDANLAVAEGLSVRSEPSAIRRLASSLDAETLGMTRQVLGGVNPLMGLAAQATGHECLAELLECCGQSKEDDAEIAERRCQLYQYAQQREEQIATDIRLAVANVESQVRQVAAHKQIVASWNQQVERLQEKRPVGAATFAELTEAKLRRLEAESTLTTRVVDWKIAGVKLREAQGLLYEECRAFVHASVCHGGVLPLGGEAVDPSSAETEEESPTTPGQLFGPPPVGLSGKGAATAAQTAP